MTTPPQTWKEIKPERYPCKCEYDEGIMCHRHVEDKIKKATRNERKQGRKVKKKDLKGKLKPGIMLVDDVGETYLVLEVFTNCAILSPVDNWQNYACEIMSYTAMNNEGWQILKPHQITCTNK